MWRVAERVWFTSTSGPRLAGLIDHPEGLVRGWGVFAHGFTLGKDTPAASRICKQLARDAMMDNTERAFRELQLQNLPTSTAAAVNDLASYD